MNSDQNNRTNRDLDELYRREHGNKPTTPADAKRSASANKKTENGGLKTENRGRTGDTGGEAKLEKRELRTAKDKPATPGIDIGPSDRSPSQENL